MAIFLRFFRLAQLTEFLGDQGRTGIHIYEAWKNKQLPLVGPTVLSGQHLGPAFYYLMAPAFIFTRFNPVAPAVMTAFFGVAAVGLLWLLGKELFGDRVAIMIASVWAVSPQIVVSDRTLWEPNIIPFFVFLFLFCFIKKWHFLAGIALGILVQLHYPNLLFIGLALLFGINAKMIAGFLVTVSPFLYYEITHGFKNIMGVFTNYSSAGQIHFLANFLDYSGRVMRRIVPIPAGWEPMALVGLLFPLAKPSFWKLFVGLWFIVGLSAISLYRGVVFDHYLFFLLPAAYLLFGFLLARLSKTFTAFAILLLIIVQLSKTDIFKPAVNDISRTKSVSAEIIRLAAEKPFSFGLIASRSFSDLHYRYFFITKGLNPEPVLSEDYKNLFLVCETDSCPKAMDSVQLLCYDAYCKGEYPKVSLDLWKIVSTSEVSNARLYQYER